MAQTPAGQAKAQSKIASSELRTLRTNEAARDKVASAVRPNVSLGATRQNTAALRRNKVIKNITGSSPASDAGLGV
jgi:hypothetical protein